MWLSDQRDNLLFFPDGTICLITVTRIRLARMNAGPDEMLKTKIREFLREQSCPLKSDRKLVPFLTAWLRSEMRSMMPVPSSSDGNEESGESNPAQNLVLCVTQQSPAPVPPSTKG